MTDGEWLLATLAGGVRVVITLVAIGGLCAMLGTMLDWVGRDGRKAERFMRGTVAFVATLLMSGVVVLGFHWCWLAGRK